MAEVSRVNFLEAGMTEIELIADRHVDGIGSQVVNQAIQHATARPGPRIRTGALVEGVEKQAGRDAQGFFVDVGSTATSSHSAKWQNYPYPSRLETGEDGLLFPWLRPALEQVMRAQQ